MKELNLCVKGELFLRAAFILDSAFIREIAVLFVDLKRMVKCNSCRYRINYLLELLNSKYV